MCLYITSICNQPVMIPMNLVHSDVLVICMCCATVDHACLKSFGGKKHSFGFYLK